MPAGVTQVGVKLVGAPGGNGGKTGILTPTGGKGGTVNATLSGLTQGTTLFVEVGGKGGDGGLVAVGAGGFNGGASGGTGGSASGGGGGGGGESDIRTCSIASCPQSLSSRLVIAAGGGAAGGTGSACCGSPAGGAGQDAATLQTPAQVAEQIVALCLPSFSESGKLYNYPTKTLMEFRGPAAV